jgi:hypothetical protein
MDWIDVIMFAINSASTQNLTLKTLNIETMVLCVLNATFCHGHDGAL